MKRKNVARNAFVTSVISLLLCVSMLVGTTFAWFTDEVTTGMNTIAAGNLDVELYANGEQVNSATKLFDDVALWEPGVVVYENLQIKNVGTLALKYQMSLNFGNENDLNGHKLSEVLKVVVLNQTIDASTMTRYEVLELAKAAAADEQGKGTLNNFYLTGELEAKTDGAAFAVVIYWEPNANEIDNLYNANNGQTTSDGEALHIEFGVNLQATQKMSEEDSFGKDYDESAAILPKATVNNTGAQTVPVYMGYDEEEIALNTTMQFLPNETEDVAAVSDYKDWHADYVITADRFVPAESMALAGYYEAWCGNNGWVVLTGGDVAAGEEVRLVAGLMNGNTVSYEEICQYGNDGVGFLCGAKDLTGANAGTTITVQLRMYEVDPESSTLSTTDSETGYYEIIGEYTYTFPAAKVSTMAELEAAVKAGAKLIDAQGSNLGDYNYGVKFTDGTVLKNAKFTYMYGASVDGTVTFENCEFVSDHSYSANFSDGNTTGNIIFNNCLFDGWSSFGTTITNVEMNGCTFKWNNPYSMLRFYQDAQLKNCVFEAIDGIDNGEVSGTTITLTNCTGIEGKIYNNTLKNGTVMISKWIVDGVELTDVPAW